MDWFFSHRLPLALAIKEQGWDLAVLAKGAGGDPRLKEYGFEGVNLMVEPGKLNPISALKTYKQIKDIIRSRDPDIVQSISVKNAFYTGLAVRRVGHKKRFIRLLGLGFYFLDMQLRQEF